MTAAKHCQCFRVKLDFMWALHASLSLIGGALSVKKAFQGLLLDCQNLAEWGSCIQHVTGSWATHTKKFCASVSVTGHHCCCHKWTAPLWVKKQPRTCVLAGFMGRSRSSWKFAEVGKSWWELNGNLSPKAFCCHTLFWTQWQELAFPTAGSSGLMLWWKHVASPLQRTRSDETAWLNF